MRGASSGGAPTPAAQSRTISNRRARFVTVVAQNGWGHAPRSSLPGGKFQHCGNVRFLGKNRVDRVGNRRTFGAFLPLVREEGPMSLRRLFTGLLLMVALPSISTRAFARRSGSVGPADEPQVRDLLSKLA